MNSRVEETIQMYVGLRKRGQDANTVLQTLRFRIELLDAGSRAEVVRRVKDWETEQAAPVVPVQPVPVKRLKPIQREAAPALKPNADVTICPKCGRSNDPAEVFCFHCGQFLCATTSNYDTVRLGDSEPLRNHSDYFGEDSTLVLQVASTNQTYKLRPAEYQHEIIFGRAVGGTMRPDIDLSNDGASNMGVSRLHTALQYDRKQNALTITDLRSANGTYINGQRLHAQEVRVLRHGDELRLGRLVLRVYFYHQPVDGGS